MPKYRFDLTIKFDEVYNIEERRMIAGHIREIIIGHGLSNRGHPLEDPLWGIHSSACTCKPSLLRKRRTR